MAAKKELDRSISETLGERLTRLRKERGLTQYQLSEYLEVSQPIISGIENGEIRMNSELLIKLAKKYGVTTDEILGLAPPNPILSKLSPKLVHRMQQIESLSKRDREALIRTIDAFLNN